jgi:hypothetical protein
MAMNHIDDLCALAYARVPDTFRPVDEVFGPHYHTASELLTEAERRQPLGFYVALHQLAAEGLVVLETRHVCMRSGTQPVAVPVKCVRKVTARDATTAVMH